MKFNIGDLVELKSGGPEMTIHSIVGDSTNEFESSIFITKGYKEGDLICKWFLNGNVQSEIFKAETVTKIKPN